MIRSRNPNRRDSSIPSIRVRKETRLAMMEVIAASGEYASHWELNAFALMAGDQMTSYGPFSEVIRRELER
jgi:hypothetical protein